MSENEQCKLWKMWWALIICYFSWTHIITFYRWWLFRYRWWRNLLRHIWLFSCTSGISAFRLCVTALCLTWFPREQTLGCRGWFGWTHGRKLSKSGHWGFTSRLRNCHRDHRGYGRQERRQPLNAYGLHVWMSWSTLIVQHSPTYYQRTTE